jgi:hypothetical protein
MFIPLEWMVIMNTPSIVPCMLPIPPVSGGVGDDSDALFEKLQPPHAATGFEAQNSYLCVAEVARRKT